MCCCASTVLRKWLSATKVPSTDYFLTSAMFKSVMVSCISLNPFLHIKESDVVCFKTCHSVFVFSATFLELKAVNCEVIVFVMSPNPAHLHKGKAQDRFDLKIKVLCVSFSRREEGT